MANKPAKVKEEAQPVVSGKGSYALTIYFYAVVEGRRFPAQQTLSCDEAEAFTAMLPEFYAAFIPGDDDAVVYEPREIGPAQRGSGGSGAKGATAQKPDRVEGPVCPFHNVPTTQKVGRTGPFFSCSKKKADGTWCNWKPPEQD